MDIKSIPGHQSYFDLPAFQKQLLKLSIKFNTTKFVQIVHLGILDIPYTLWPERTAAKHRRSDFDYRSEELRDPKPSIDTRVLIQPGGERYRHQQLPSQRSVRLLHLLPGREQDHLEVYLTTHDIEHAPPFDALSYAWGSGQEYYISCNGRPFPVRANLISALCTLRNESKERTIWVDAICINQQDKSERNLQVRLMHDIYMRSRNTLIWLGVASDNIPQAFRLIDELAKLQRALPLSHDPASVSWVLRTEIGSSHSANSPCIALDQMLWREWFHRIWPVQELALSNDPLIICGDISRPWQDLEDAAWFIRSHKMAGETGINPRNVTQLREVRRLLGDRNDTTALMGMLVNGRDSDASDDRDKLYAMFGLLMKVSDLKEKDPEIFSPRYDKPVTHVYVDFSMRLISATQSLDCLSAVEDHRLRLKRSLPHWVPDWEVPIFARPFCQLQQFWSWNASGARHQAIKFKQSLNPKRIRHRDLYCELSTDGVVIDEVAYVGSSFTENVPPSGIIKPKYKETKPLIKQNLDRMVHNACMYHRILQWEHTAMINANPTLSPEDKLKTFIYTITAGADIQTQFGADVVGYYHIWRDLTPRLSSLRRRTAKQDEEALNTTHYQIAVEFLHQHYRAAYRRRFFTTKSDYMGLGPSLTRIGDRVVLLKGGRTPYIVKPRRGEKKYRFTGEAYVHPLMQGETVDEMKFEEIRIV